MPRLDLHNRRVAERRVALSEIEDYDQQLAASLAVDAAELDLRAEIRAARADEGRHTISLAEAEALRREIIGRQALSGCMQA